MKPSSPTIEAQNATLKAKLKRARARIRRMKDAPAPNVTRESSSSKNRQPYIVDDGKTKNPPEGSQFRERRREQGSRIIVLVPGGSVDVNEIIKRIA